MKKTYLAGALLAASSLALIPTPTAQADPRQVNKQVIQYVQQHGKDVCQNLSELPTFDGVVITFAVAKSDSGLTSDETAQIVVLSVETTCPRYMPLLRDFVATYSHSGSFT